MDEIHIKPPPAAVQAAIAARLKLAERFPVGCRVRAVVPLAHPKPGEIVKVLGVTADGSLRLDISPAYVAHAHPEHLEIVADELDTDPF